MDEAGRGKRRPDDASFRNDDLFLDVHHAALAAARSVGARARAYALEPERAVRPQATRLSAEAGAGFSPRRARAAANTNRLHPGSLHQVPGRHAGSTGSSARQIVPECPLSTM